MTTELRLAKMDLHATGALYESATPPVRNLGDAILLAAIDDYRSRDEEAHEDARRFLYPQTAEWQEQYEWAVALAVGLNAAWLRDALDRVRAKWDLQRAARRGPMRPLRRKVS
jgi:hypothetical protein